MKLGAFGARPAGLFVFSLAALAGGCNSDDAGRLARVGRKVVAKVEALTGNADSKLTKGLQALRGEWDEAPVDGRVAARLRWDKELADAQIEVFSEGGVLKLRGTVHDLAQRRRAVELAESTAGVQQIVDILEVPAEAP